MACALRGATEVSVLHHLPLPWKRHFAIFARCIIRRFVSRRRQYPQAVKLSTSEERQLRLNLHKPSHCLPAASPCREIKAPVKAVRQIPWRRITDVSSGQSEHAGAVASWSGASPKSCQGCASPLPSASQPSIHGRRLLW